MVSKEVEIGLTQYHRPPAFRFRSHWSIDTEYVANGIK